MAKPCIECGAVSQGTRCPTCARARANKRQRPAYRQAYSDPAYRQARDTLRGQPCWICGQPSDTVDHIVALAKGGTNHPANLAPACRPCNSRRGAN